LVSQRDHGAQARAVSFRRIIRMASYIDVNGGTVRCSAAVEDEMISLLSATMVGALVLAAAAPLPKFNVEPSCRAAAKRAGDPSYVDVCLRKEQEAREQIQRQWREFTSGDKSQCIPRTRVFDRGTYTELLTCLELARALRDLRKNDTATTGQIPKQTR
jgi:hypothetical protein